MPWVLTKAPVCWHGATLSEDDLGTIKIALASAASTTGDYWGRIHSCEDGKNIYDCALDKVMTMEEEETTYESVCLSENELLVLDAIDRLTPANGNSTKTSWFGHLLNQLFLWL